MVFQRDHNWFFDGTKEDFEASTKDDDFFTVALHETGHVVGLDHQTDADDIMKDDAGFKVRVKAGGAFRALSPDDINGARDLYSVPVPEPSSVFGTLALGLLGLIGIHKKC